MLRSELQSVFHHVTLSLGDDSLEMDALAYSLRQCINYSVVSAIIRFSMWNERRVRRLSTADRPPSCRINNSSTKHPGENRHENAGYYTKDPRSYQGRVNGAVGFLWALSQQYVPSLASKIIADPNVPQFDRGVTGD